MNTQIIQGIDLLHFSQLYNLQATRNQKILFQGLMDGKDFLDEHEHEEVAQADQVAQLHQLLIKFVKSCYNMDFVNKPGIFICYIAFFTESWPWQSQFWRWWLAWSWGWCPAWPGCLITFTFDNSCKTVATAPALICLPRDNKVPLTLHHNWEASSFLKSKPLQCNAFNDVIWPWLIMIKWQGWII